MVECPAWLAYTKALIVSNRQNRRPGRLPNYDYRQAGAYFVTICTNDRELFFENSAIRAIAKRFWLAIPKHFPIVRLDKWVLYGTLSSFLYIGFRARRAQKPSAPWAYSYSEKPFPCGTA